MSDHVTISEGCAAIGCTSEVLEGLTRLGPFACDADGTLSMQKLLGASVCLSLPPSFEVTEAIAIAVAASEDAKVGGSRSLMVTWATGQMAAHWIKPDDKLPIVPLLVIPSEPAITRLAQQIAAHRRAPKN